MEGDSYLNCTSLTTSQFRHLSEARRLTGIICAGLCLLTLSVILCTKTWQYISQRLFLYLTVSTLAYMIVLSMNLECYYRYYREDMFCRIVGCIVQYAGVVQLLLIFNITLYLDVQVITTICCATPIDQLPLVRNITERASMWTKFGLEFLVFIFPALFISLVALIPWFVGAPYGETGPWCWISTLVQHTCKKSKTAFWEQIGLWYIPLGIVAVCSLGFIAMMFFVFLCGVKVKKIAQKITRITHVETFLLMVFMAAYFIMCVIDIVSHAIAVTHDIYGMWMLYAISTPISGAIIPFSFLIYINRSTLQNCYQRICKTNPRQQPTADEDATGAERSLIEETASDTHVPLPSVTDCSHESQPLLHSAKTQYCCIM